MSKLNIVKVRENGPLVCMGEIEVYDADGTLLQKSDNLVLCRCGHSRNKPFCDGSHRDAGFQSSGEFTGIKSDKVEGEGPLKITVRTNAMLVAEGPMSINGADNTPVGKRNKAALCRCGRSGNKPFCDLSHKHEDIDS